MCDHRIARNCTLRHLTPIYAFYRSQKMKNMKLSPRLSLDDAHTVKYLKNSLRKFSRA